MVYLEVLLVLTVAFTTCLVLKFGSKRKEVALRESEKNFSALAENANTGILIALPNGHYVYANKQATKITGYSVSELTELNMNQLTQPEEASMLTDRLKKRLGGESVPKLYEAQIIRKDGKTITIEITEAKTIWHGQEADIVIFLDVTERNLAEKKLRENEEKLQLIIDKSPIGICTVDSLGNFVTTNIVYEQMVGYSKEELSSLSFLDVTHSDDHAENEKLYQDMFSLKTAGFTIEKRYIRKDGIEIEVIAHTVKITGIKGNGDFGMAFVEDVTEHNSAERETRLDKLFIDRVVDMSPFPMWIADQDGMVIRVNNSLCETTNLTEDQIVGQYNILNDENIEIQGVMPMVTAVFEKYLPANFSIPWKPAKAGDVSFEATRDMFLDISIFPIVSDSGKLTNIVCQWVDITEHKENEEALRESQAKFKSIIDNISIGVALINPAMEILEINNKMLEWFPEYTSGKNIYHNNFPHNEKDCDSYPTYKTLKDGKAHETTITNQQNDKTRNYRITSSPLVNSQGEVTAVIEMVDDTTDRMSLQAQVMQSEKMDSIGMLAGGVAHDYNNISNIILGYSELAMEKVDHGDPLYDDLMEVYAAAKRSTGITRQLLAFARQQTIAPKIIDLNDIIENMLKMLRRLIGEDIDLAWKPVAKVWMVKIDPSQIDQIIINLLVNSRDAIADVGKVTVETKNISFNEEYCANHTDFFPGEYVLLAVSDDGTGIVPDIMGKIFEPFFTTKPQDKGTGMGLATVYGIVKQNGGFINVYSEPGEGTTVKVYLSRHIGQVVEAKLEEILKIPLSCGETILLVDDDGPILRLGKKMLEDLDYTVWIASNPNEAVKLAKELSNKVNLLITDVVMPEMNGKQLSEQLQMNYPGIKTLFMSGYTANVIAHRGVLEEGVNFIQKPFSKKDLAIKVRLALDKDG